MNVVEIYIECVSSAVICVCRGIYVGGNLEVWPMND